MFFRGKEISLQIGGIGFSLECTDFGIIDWKHLHYRDFIYAGKADVNLRIHSRDLPEFDSTGLLFDGKEEGGWKLYRNDSRYIVEIFDTKTRRKNKVCFMADDFSSGDVYIDPKSEQTCLPRIRKYRIFSLPHLMRPLCELILVNLLAEEGGIMTHGLGISDRGEGMAFLGGSGSGKSTLAGYYKNEPEVKILSDEHIIIRNEKNQFRLYGTPWPGMAMATSEEGVPLKKIFFIEHAPENSLLGRGMISDLFPLLFLPFWDKIRLEAILRLCEDLIKRMECEKLGFTKGRSVIDFIRGGEEG